MRKKRILMCNESSVLSTGYATYGLEVLKRLYATGKYELAELATYGHINDKKAKSLPWKQYPVVPPDNRPDLIELYNSKSENQWGAWCFEDVCIEFQPDIVFDIRDPWMVNYQCTSPARKYFKHALMPTVDSMPQEEKWLPIYTQADAIFSYCDWGGKELCKQTNNKIKYMGTASPAFDVKNYEHLEKSTAKKMLGFRSDDLVLGTVMRNQVRKLYPDLFKAFRKFLDEQERAPLYTNESKRSLGERALLYVHCQWPDVGWNIPSLLKEFCLGNKVLFNYYCLNCKKVYASYFQDGQTICKYCGEDTAVLPGIKTGVSPKALNHIYAAMDLYVQYANCEGFGMPMVEAAASGTPICATNYSAMEDAVRILKGYPIKVERMFKDAGVGSYRALPDEDSLINIIKEYFLKEKQERSEIESRTRRLAEINYDWNKTTKMWENYFDSVIPVDKWKSPAKIHSPQLDVPGGMSDNEFVNWGLANIAGSPELIGSETAMRLIRHLGLGRILQNEKHTSLSDVLAVNDESLSSYFGHGTFTREIAARLFVSLCNRKNEFEKRRFNYVSNSASRTT